MSSTIAILPIGQPIPGIKSAFYRLYGMFEQPFFLMLGLFAVAVLVYSRVAIAPDQKGEHERFTSRWLVPGLAVATMIAAWVGSRAVMLSFPLSMDEFNAIFQSKIFAAGRLSARVPGAWQPLVPGIIPGFVTYRPIDHTWLSAYLPVYALLRAAALKLSAASLLNPVFAGLSVIAVAAVARKIWPGSRLHAGLAAFLLVGSSQFLFMSMSLYSMPAHLLFNLTWLWLYLEASDGTFSPSALALPWVGVGALGLHNPFPHALVAAPFLLRLVRMRRRPVVLYTVGVYGLGCALWLAWFSRSLGHESGSAARAAFGVPGAVQFLMQLMNLTLMASWQTPLLALAAVVGLSHARSLDPVKRDLAIGLVLSYGFYFFFKDQQGHGWGYRYIYGALGNLVLLAVVGLESMARTMGARKVGTFVVASLVVTFCVQVPLRAVDIRGFVSPFLAAQNYLDGSAQAVLIIPINKVWYGPDLIRNGPFLRDPVLISRPWLDAHSKVRDSLFSSLDDEVRYVHPDELNAPSASFGTRPQ